MFKKLICLSLVVVFLISGCKSENPDIIKTKGTLNMISASKALEKINQGDNMILVMGTTTCGSCIEYKEAIKLFIEEYDVEFYFVEIDNEPVVKDSDGTEKRPELSKLLEVVGKIDQTPTTFIIKNKEIVNVKVGSMDHKDIKIMLSDHDIMKNDKKQMGSINKQSSKEVLAALDHKESFILVVGTSTCGSCIEFEKVMEKYIKKETINFQHVIIDDEEQEVDQEGNTIRPSFLALQERIGKIVQTPAVFIIADGEIVKQQSGGMTLDELNKWLNN